MTSELQRDRIYLAQRAGVRQRLIDEARLSADAVDRLLDEWDEEAGRRMIATRTSAYWAHAWDWIAARRREQRA